MHGCEERGCGEPDRAKLGGCGSKQRKLSWESGSCEGCSLCEPNSVVSAWRG